MAVFVESPGRSVVANRKAPTGVIRPFDRTDIPGVARLFDRTFRKGPGEASRRLEKFFEDVFFDAPTQIDTKLRSYVFENDQASIGGFVGTHPRRFLLDGRPVTAATYGQLMVAPEMRGKGIAFLLVERFYDGGQGYSFCCSAAPATRTINERLGGINPSVKGLSWRKTLRPGIAFARRLSVARKLGPLRHLAVPLATAIASARGSGDSGCALDDTMGVADPGEMESVRDRSLDGDRFRPAVSADEFAWKLSVASSSDRCRVFTRVVKSCGSLAGSYVWQLTDDRAGSVLEMHIVRGCDRAVISDLFRCARLAGAIHIGGVCNNEAEADAIRAAGAVVSQVESTVVFHSHQTDLLTAFPDGPAHLSSFDGEGWLGFPM